MRLCSFELIFENCLLKALSLGNIKSHSVNEPRSSIVFANHLRFALKPKRFSVARDDAIRRSQWLARKEHLRGFQAPSHLVIGMNLLVPPHGILKPLALRETQSRFDLRAYVGFADTFIQVSHEHDRGYLLNESPVLRLHTQ